MRRGKIALLSGFFLILALSAYGDPKWGAYEVKIDASQVADPGDIVPVEINLTRCDQDFGGYDILLRFDSGDLAVAGVDQGQWLIDCGWEYFEYRTDLGPGLVRIVAVADVVAEPGSPTCYIGTGPIAVVNFEVLSKSRGFEPIQFIWQDCGDNAFSNIAGDTLFISDEVFDWDGTRMTGDPEIGGASLDCLIGPTDGVIAQWMEFTHGGITVDTPPPPEGCDPNGDGEPWQIDDIVFLIDYIFLGGTSPDPIETGDCDCDGRINMIDITQSICYLFRGCPDPCE